MTNSAGWSGKIRPFASDGDSSDAKMESIPVRERLRIAREAGLYQPEDMDLGLDLQPGTFQEWESGKGWPELDHLIRFTDVLGISLDILLKGGRQDLRSLGDAVMMIRAREDVKRAIWDLEALADQSVRVEGRSNARRTALIIQCLLDADSARGPAERIGHLTRQIVWAQSNLEQVERTLAGQSVQTTMAMSKDDLIQAQERIADLLAERRKRLSQLGSI